MRLIRSDARDQVIHRKKCPLVLVSIFSSLAVAEFAHMRHLREFRSPAIFEFFNTIGAKPTFHRPLSDVSLRSRLGAVVWTPNDLMLIHLADELHEMGAATRNVLMVSRISAVASLLDVLSPAETKRLGTLIVSCWQGRTPPSWIASRSAGCATIGSVRIARCPQPRANSIASTKCCLASAFGPTANATLATRPHGMDTDRTSFAPETTATKPNERKRTQTKRSKINKSDRYPVAHNGLVAGSSSARPTSLRSRSE